MGKAVIGWNNLLDAGVVSASSSLGGPAANLQHRDVNRRWRSLPSAGPAWVVLGLPTASAVGCVALMNVGGFDPGDAWRIRFASADATGSAGDLYDTGSHMPPFNPMLPLLIHVVPGADVAGVRFVRVDLPAGASAGRAFVGPLFRPTHSFAAGHEVVAEDPSARTEARGGQWFIDDRPRRRGFVLRWAAITIAEWRTQVEPMARLNGTSVDVLVCLDPEGGDPGRDTLWGLLGGRDGRSPPVRAPSRADAGMYHEMSIEIWERI